MAICAGCAVWLWRLRYACDVLLLGKNLAINLGVGYRSLGLQLLCIIAILVSVSTALVGPVTFLGLLVCALTNQMSKSMYHSERLMLVALIAMLCSAFALAIGTVWMKGLEGFDMANQQGWMAAISLLPLLAISHLIEPGSLAALPQASWKAWSGVAFAALGSSLLGHGLYYVLIKRHPVAQMMPWLLLVPVLAVALGVLFWGDRPGMRVWIGGAMVLGGILVIALRRRARVAEAHPQEI